MTTRFVKGKARTETPRLKDHHTPRTARDPSAGRDARGQFSKGNGAAIGRGAKQIVREALSRVPPELVRDALTLYRACLRELPSDGPSVRQLTAARCRHAVLATCFTNEAVSAGLTTPLGMKLAEAARSHDLAAQRLAVTAFDIASKEASAVAGAKTNPWLTPPVLPAETSGSEGPT